MSSEHGVWEWVRRIDEFGFCLVSGVPADPESTEALVRRITFIRETHYGAFWDFTANLAHGDLAYSPQALRAHTDTSYFSDPCGLQLFHLLSPRSTHEGGHNLLVDGFACAAQLKRAQPKTYEFLSRVRVPAHASGTGSDTLPSGVFMRPHLHATPLTHDAITGELAAVRWNADDRDVVGSQVGWDASTVEQWYDAVRAWEAILRDEKNELWTIMEPGTAIIFDNMRVLHGRSSYVGKRRLCGAYVAGDDYRSRVMGLARQHGPRDDEWDAELKRFGVVRERGDDAGVWAGYL